MYREMTQIVGHASFCIPDSPPPFAASFAEIEVDTGTGRIPRPAFRLGRRLRHTHSPAAGRGPDRGARCRWASATRCAKSFATTRRTVDQRRLVDYKLIHADDMPEMTTIVVQSYEPTGPFGAKSVAEVPTNGPAPAIANAFLHATGVRIPDLPLTPDRVLRALGKI
jgi:putative selenate reductase molybdopterin-binding subunit